MSTTHFTQIAKELEIADDVPWQFQYQLSIDMVSQTSHTWRKLYYNTVAISPSAPGSIRPHGDSDARAQSKFNTELLEMTDDEGRDDHETEEEFKQKRELADKRYPSGPSPVMLDAKGLDMLHELYQTRSYLPFVFLMVGDDHTAADLDAALRQLPRNRFNVCVVCCDELGQEMLDFIAVHSSDVAMIVNHEPIDLFSVYRVLITLRAAEMQPHIGRIVASELQQEPKRTEFVNVLCGIYMDHLSDEPPTPEERLYLQ